MSLHTSLQNPPAPGETPDMTTTPSGAVGGNGTTAAELRSFVDEYAVHGKIRSEVSSIIHKMIDAAEQSRLDSGRHNLDAQTVEGIRYSIGRLAGEICCKKSSKTGSTL